MYRLILTLLTGCIGLGASAQGFVADQKDPVEWRHFFEQQSDSTFLLVMEADIETGWHLYCPHSDPGGAFPMEFEFPAEGEAYQRSGPMVEGETHVAYNEVFGVDETFFKEHARLEQTIRITGPLEQPVKVYVYYQVCETVCIPGEAEFIFELPGTKGIAEPLEDPVDPEQNSRLELDLKNTVLLGAAAGSGAGGGAGGLPGIFLLGFLGGLLALLTPCVFPMIPLTVSFFTKKDGNRSRGTRQAILYGFFIVLIYFLLSLPFHLFESADAQILNAIATNIWLNLFFFLVFIVFAFSFFGYYEITLPSSWAARMDAASERTGGALGVFFMALTLAIVSFSCTGPILGGLLGSTALSEGDVASNLSAGMLGFGLALALPFALFALFPSWMNRLPRSGSWMETVKVVLGFLELGLALKFLSNADLVGHWGILKREVFLALWILLALGLFAYLMGWFRFDKVREKAAPGRWRIGGGLLSLAFAAYLGYGLVTSQPLTLLSGFPPPDFYSLKATDSDCPLGLDCYKDFESGWEASRTSGKPILLDFTGWACVNCRKMEEQVWSDPGVYRLINEEYILVSLYVDDREELEEPFTYHFQNGKTKRIRTIGDFWGTFQTVNFGSISQPYYVLLSPELEIIAPPVQNTNTEKYRRWLANGLQSLRAREEVSIHP